MGLFSRKPAPPVAPADSEAAPLAAVILTDIAVRTGQDLVRRGIETGLLGGKPAPTGRVIRGQTLTQTVVGTVLGEVARRSVPGALLVGGALLAQALRDRRRARAALTAKPDEPGPA